jgi:hypothetical protein
MIRVVSSMEMDTGILIGGLYESSPISQKTMCATTMAARMRAK